MPKQRVALRIRLLRLRILQWNSLYGVLSGSADLKRMRMHHWMRIQTEEMVIVSINHSQNDFYMDLQ